MPKKLTKDFPLLAALQFISVAQRANGSELERYCRMSMNAAVSFNGLLAAGQRIEETLQCCPQTDKLIAALLQCDEGYSLTQHTDRLVVTSGTFTAAVPICDPSLLTPAWPDAKQFNVNDDVRAAMIAVHGIVDDKAERVWESAVLLQGKTCQATNGNVMLESWHGWDLPPNVLLPKAIIKSMVKVKKELVGIGYGDATVTFWFADNTWIRTQRYIADWPKSNAFDARTNPVALEPTLFAAARQLGTFSEDGQLYCLHGQASSHPFTKPNAFNAQLRRQVHGFTESRVYQLRSLYAVEPFATSYDDTAMPRRTYVYGVGEVKLGSKKAERVNVKLRGVIVHSMEDEEVDAGMPAPVGSMETWKQTYDPQAGLVCDTCHWPAALGHQAGCPNTSGPITDEDIPF
jgi:hypothetical protein